MKRILFLTIFICSSNYGFDLDAFKESINYKESSVSIGNYTEFLGSVQVSTSGSKNGIDFHPFLRLRTEHSLGSFIISPVATLIAPFSPNDSKYMTVLKYSFDCNLHYELKQFSPFIGVGLFFTRINGKGGELQLNNGLGTTGFQLPQEAVVAMNTVVNTGIQWKPLARYSAFYQMSTFNLTDKYRRDFGHWLGVSYHF